MKASSGMFGVLHGAGLRVAPRVPRLIAALTVFLSVPALAMVVPLEIADLVRSSEVIVQGRVAQLTSKRDGEGSGITTAVTVNVDAVVLSRSERTRPEGQITFHLEGGEIGEEEMRTSLDPALKEGEEGVFFLGRGDGGKGLTLVGGQQGLYRMQNGTVRVAGQNRPVRAFLEEIRQHLD